MRTGLRRRSEFEMPMNLPEKKLSFWATLARLVKGWIARLFKSKEK
jgi:hypothetical protein